MSEVSELLPVERRREAFAALVEAQDGGTSVAISRRVVAVRFGISVEAIARIEREGLDNDWPPL